MNKLIQLIAFLLLITTGTYANEISNGIGDILIEKIEATKDSLVTIKTPKAKKTVTSLPIKTSRKFKSLERFDTPIKIAEKTIVLDDTKEGFQFSGANAVANQDWLTMANNVFAKIEETQNFIDLLTDESLKSLPVAITPIEISNVTYTVGIAKATFKPQHTELTVFLKIETPRTTTTSTNTTTENGIETATVTNQETNVLILGASDIKLSHDGGIIGDARLNLISQFTFNLNNGAMLLKLNGGFNTPGTYATIDCSGFKELGIDADLEFSSEYIFPVDAQGKKQIGRVAGKIKTEIADWNDWVVNVSLPEFGVQGLEGTTFKMETAVFDFSDLRNDEMIPAEYINRYYQEAPELWRGVYIKQLDVLLPEAFKKNNSSERAFFKGTDMIIDGQGVTGKFEGKDIFTIDEGSASGWQFSLEYFLVDIEVNKLKSGAFNGEIILPVSEVDRLTYQAIIQPNQYSLQVSNVNEIDFNIWKAKVLLTENSSIEMTVADGKFRPKATLHGSFGIETGLSSGDGENSGTVNFKGITFENMVLQTESPKFSIGNFGYEGGEGKKLANFPVIINDIRFDNISDVTAELAIDLSINLTSENDGANGGRTSLAIKGKLDASDGRDRWKYDGIELERIFVQMAVAGMQVKGSVFIFEDDPTYGTGFAGTVGAKFNSGIDLDIEAKALFGRTEEFRYWFVDAHATLPQGIPIFPGFEAKGFGGGFYNHMKMAGVNKNVDAAFNEIGVSSSGVIYQPYQQNSFGMKALLKVTTQNSEELFSGTLEYGISFASDGGLQEIYYKGHGEIIANLPDDFYSDITEQLSLIADEDSLGLPIQKPGAGITTDVFVTYDFTNDFLHATAEVYINLGIIEGTEANGRAGWLDFYVDFRDDEWHLLIGTPMDPIGVKLDLAIIEIQTNAYFMAGHDIPGSPPPPKGFTDATGLDLNYNRDLNQIKDANGIAFGTHWQMTTGDLRFLIFYARFSAGVGFDIMLKDYKEATCKGSSDELGINGWYANGQVYAYVEGAIGLKFKIFGISKKINIASVGLGVILQARLPNPIWMRGYVAGRYDILGGLIKGDFRFKLELGDKCEIEGESVLDGIVVISDMTPEENSTDVDVFAAPQTSFNLAINKIFDFQDDEGDHKYKILLDKFELSKDGNPIKGEIEWNDSNTLATLYSHEILPPNSNLKAYVQVHFEEYVNGSWKIITENGKPSIDTKEVNFITGTAPETIPRSNIDFMYPAIGQKNFFIDEYNIGYINLKRGQSYLFDAVPTWDKDMIMTSSSGTVMKELYGYDAAKKQLTYYLPKEIATENDYKVEIVLTPEQKNANNNVTESYTTTNLSTKDEDSGNEVELRSRELGETVINGEARELFSHDFSTSTYTTFEKKMKAVEKDEDLHNFVTPKFGLVLTTKIDPIEPFDLTELVGNAYTGNNPLIVARAVLDDSYYKKSIFPLIYEEYPLAGQFTVSRKTDKVGIPPVEGVEPLSWYLTYLEANYTSDISSTIPYRYNLTNYYYQDYDDLVLQLLNSDFPYEGNVKYSNFISGPFPIMEYGDYKTKLQYVLPGQLRNGGDDTIKYRNPLYK